MRTEKDYEIASLSRRFGALIIDTLLIFIIWYLFTKSDLAEVNNLMTTLDPNVDGSLDIFSEAIIKLYLNFFLKWIIISTVFYTIFPAVFGNGRTFGKILTGISVVDSDSLDEISPSRLVIREFLLRNIFEIILIIPGIVSCFLVYFRKDSKAIHDLWTRSIVIKGEYKKD